MRRQVGTIPKTLETKLEEGDYYEALQLYKSLQSRYFPILLWYLYRYEGAGKYKESDELILHGVQNYNYRIYNKCNTPLNDGSDICPNCGALNMSFNKQFASQMSSSESPAIPIDENELSINEGKAVNPSLIGGICGEHGGDPDSVKFAHKIGLNYVSCSPYRVPQARLAAAQAVIEQGTLVKA